MDNIPNLWPDTIEDEPITTPFNIVREQARVLSRLMETRIEASVTNLPYDDDDPRPFQYTLCLSSVAPSGSALESLRYVVASFLHGVDMYPVEVRPYGQMVDSEAELLELLQEVLGSPEVRRALRVLGSVNAPEVYCERLVPDDYYLAPLRTPGRILQEQCWAFRKVTDNLVKAVVRKEYEEGEPSYGSFRFGMYLQPCTTEFLPALDYKIMEIKHGLELYPVTAWPGEIPFTSEEDFLEFVRQELASDDVRKAVRIVASFARQSPVTRFEF